MTAAISPSEKTQVFVRRNPDSPWERVPIGVDIGVDIEINYRPSWWEHLEAAQGYMGWTYDELVAAWREFSTQGSLRLFFDVDDIALMFHALAALDLAARCAEWAQEGSE